MDDYSIYSNDNYRVEIDEEAVGDFGGVIYAGMYVIINNLTGVSEYYTPSLPDALRFATHASNFLDKELHLWAAKAGQLDIEFEPEEPLLPGERKPRLDS